jgi:hypothetical protein
MSKNSGILRQCPRIPEFKDNVQKFRNFKTMSKNSGILRQCPQIPEFQDNVQEFRNLGTMFKNSGNLKTRNVQHSGRRTRTRTIVV